MEVVFKGKALKDRAKWKKSGQVQVQEKISALIEDMLKTPYEGLGKPEPLKYSLAGCWSRRISDEHRIIYEVAQDEIHILSMKGHYI